jgi:hypothetical protein
VGSLRKTDEIFDHMGTQKIIMGSFLGKPTASRLDSSTYFTKTLSSRTGGLGGAKALGR